MLAAGILWGCMGLLVRSMQPFGFTSMEIVMFRAMVTSVLMGLGMLLFNRRGLRVKLKDLWCFAGTGIASMVFFNFCYFSCMNHTTLSVAAILLYTAPAFLMLMSAVIFKEKFTWLKVICLIATFAGCVLVSGGLPIGRDAGTLSLPGLLFGLGAGFGYALYSVFSRFAIKRGYSSFTITTYTFWFATLGCAPFISWPHYISTVRESVSGLGVFLLLTVLTTILAYLLYTKGLEGMENGLAGIIASIEPVMASVVGTLVFHEKLTVPGIAGMVLVLGACVLVSLPGRKGKG